MFTPGTVNSRGDLKNGLSKKARLLDMSILLSFPFASFCLTDFVWHHKVKRKHGVSFSWKHGVWYRSTALVTDILVMAVPNWRAAGADFVSHMWVPWFGGAVLGCLLLLFWSSSMVVLPAGSVLAVQSVPGLCHAAQFALYGLLPHLQSADDLDVAVLFQNLLDVWVLVRTYFYKLLWALSFRQGS